MIPATRARPMNAKSLEITRRFAVRRGYGITHRKKTTSSRIPGEILEAVTRGTPSPPPRPFIEHSCHRRVEDQVSRWEGHVAVMRIEVKSVVLKTPWIRVEGPYMDEPPSPPPPPALGWDAMSVPRQRSRHPHIGRSARRRRPERRKPRHPRLAGNVLKSRPASSLSKGLQHTGDARRGRLAPRRPRHPRLDRSAHHRRPERRRRSVTA